MDTHVRRSFESSRRCDYMRLIQAYNGSVESRARSILFEIPFLYRLCNDARLSTTSLFSEAPGCIPLGSLLLEDTWLGYQTDREIRAALQPGRDCGWNVTHATGTARLSVSTAVSRSTIASAHQARTTATNQTTASTSQSIQSMRCCLRTYSPPTGDATEQEGTAQASIT